MLFLSSFSFPLGVLSVTEGRILKSIGIIVKLSVLPFTHVSFCFKCFGALLLNMYSLKVLLFIFLLIIKCFSLSLGIFLFLKSILPHIIIAMTLLVLFVCYIFFHYFTYKLFMSFNLKHAPGRQYIVVSCLFKKCYFI